MKTLTITPRFSETDALGHINNAAIAVWFEVARMAYLEDVFVSLGESTPSWVLASLKLDYRGESLFGKEVAVDVALTRLGNSSMGLDCRMYQDGQLKVEGQSVLVYFDKQTRASVPLPAELRAKLQTELVDDFPVRPRLRGD